MRKRANKIKESANTILETYPRNTRDRVENVRFFP